MKYTLTEKWKEHFDKKIKQSSCHHYNCRDIYKDSLDYKFECLDCWQIFNMRVR